MEKIIRASLLSAFLVLSACNSEKIIDKSSLKEQKEKVSYSIGLDLGKNLKKQSIEIDPDILRKGLKDGQAGGDTLMTDKEIQETMMALQKEVMSKHAAQTGAEGQKNSKEGEDFLAKKKAEKGVITLPSGLMYKVITEGKGKTPKLTDTVSTNYRGTLINGTEFDSSYKRNQPAEFPVNRVIPGWTEALQLMKEGSKWELYIPSKLAYGEQGSPPNIPPNSVLIFELELLKVK
jgi:FKBP-type peptidyl-prolyl cis-trans isomerase FklB